MKQELKIIVVLLNLLLTGIVHAAEHRHLFPKIDGEIVTSHPVLEAESRDFGNLGRWTPIAVVFPENENDVVKIIKYAREKGLSLTPRGTSHTTNGQSTASKGIIIKTARLNKIHEITSDYALVDSGLQWRTLISELSKKDLSPPVLTDYVGMTIGGTLSAGGVGHASHQGGVQIDNVLELRVVTGRGKVEVCSREINQDLCDAVLGGLGHFGLITSVKIKLIPVKKYVQTAYAEFKDLNSMIEELRSSAQETYLYGLDGSIRMQKGLWVYKVAKSIQSETQSPLPLEQFFPRKKYIVQDSTQFYSTVSFEEFARRLDVLDSFYQPAHFNPWLNLFIPGSKIEKFTMTALGKMDPKKWAPIDYIQILPIRKIKEYKGSIFQSPDMKDEYIYFNFGVLHTTHSRERATAILERNQILLIDAMEVGGKSYLIDTLPNGIKQWQKHFGKNQNAVLEAKHKYDPDNIFRELKIK